MLLRSNFSSFPQYFQHISNFKSPITYIFVKCGCSIYFFHRSGNLICRSTDISKYFRGSLGIRDNESRLYFIFSTKEFCRIQRGSNPGPSVYQSNVHPNESSRPAKCVVRPNPNVKSIAFYPQCGVSNYSRLPLSRIPRDSLKHFQISVLRHIRVERVRKTIN